MKNNVVWLKGHLAPKDKTAQALDEINKRLERLEEISLKVVKGVKTR